MTINYNDHQFWGKILGMHTFHKICLGEGCIFLDEEDNLFISIPTSKKRLPCGCHGATHFKLDKTTNKISELTEIEEEHFHDLKIKKILNFQSSFKTNFWDKYYIDNPWDKPIKISSIIDKVKKGII